MWFMKFIENYYRNKFKQEDLERRYNSQCWTCECGFPIAHDVIKINEGFFTTRRIYVEYINICPKCHKENIRVS